MSAATAPGAAAKRSLSSFLSQNPFPQPLTLGFFFREKMRAIHRIAPNEPMACLLEIGGGQSGLSKLLYPDAQVVNVDLDVAVRRSPVNLGEQRRFVCGDASSLPFADETFDAVTAFDVLEHIPRHDLAAAEAWRVLRPGGVLLVTTPRSDWRYPFYPALRRICPPEEQLMNEWGHVRRGYSLAELEALVGRPCDEWATFISPITALAHDLAFSRLSKRVRCMVLIALSPLTWAGYAVHRAHARGTETAAVWRKREG